MGVSPGPTSTNRADLDLAARAAAGDRSAIVTIINEMSAILLQQARNVSRGGKFGADDLAQEGLMRCLSPKVLENYQGRAKLTSYLKAVAVARMIDLVRQQQAERVREHRSVWLEPSTASTPHEQIDTLGLSDAVWDAFDKEPSFVELLARLIGDGHTHREIADQLQRPAGTISATWSRAAARLRRPLEDWKSS